jgi:hypothetical protein
MVFSFKIRGGVLFLISLIFLFWAVGFSLAGGGGPVPFSGLGAGTSADPYQITNCSNFQEISSNLSAHYLMMNDVNCAGDGVYLAPSGSWFNGTLNGSNYILGNVSTSQPFSTGVGIFGYLDGNISTIGFLNISVVGDEEVGVIAGHQGSNSTLTVVYVSNASVAGADYVGGLVGVGDGNVLDSYGSDISVISSGSNAGGLIGRYSACGSTRWVNDSYFVGNITSVANAQNQVGGLIGTNFTNTCGVNWFPSVGYVPPMGVVNNSFFYGLSNNSGGTAASFSTWPYSYGYSTSNNSLSEGNDSFVGDVYNGKPNSLFGSWDFYGVWEELAGNFPVLTWQGSGSSLDVSGPMLENFSYFSTLGVNTTFYFTPYDENSVNCSFFVNDSALMDLEASLSSQNTISWNLSAGTYNWSLTCNDSSGYSTNSENQSFIVKNYTVILNCETLQNISNNLNGWYGLGQDINCINTSVPGSSDWGNQGFRPLGNTSVPFSGIFLGNNYTIFNLSINRSDTDNVGLFGYINESMNLTNFGLANVSIVGQNSVGAIVGANALYNWINYLDIQISQVYVNGTVSGSESVGGLVGNLSQNFNIIDSYFEGNVSGNTNVGGLVGKTRSGGTYSVNRSYFSGRITGNGGSLMGYMYWAYLPRLINSFSDSNFTGGLAGTFDGYAGEVTENAMSNSYYNNQSFTGDPEVSSINTEGNQIYNNSDYFRGDVSSDSQSRNPFATWDFDSIWHEVVGGYPVLQWQAIGGSVENTTLLSCANLTKDDTTYSLGKNLTTAQTCFIFGGSNITLEGNGYYLTGDFSSNVYAVDLGNSSNNNISNMFIRNFTRALSIGDGLENLTLENITFEGNSRDLSLNPDTTLNITLTNISLEVISEGVASIGWDNLATVNTGDISSAVQIAVNSITVDSENYSSFNASAQLTIYNTDDLGFTGGRYPLLNGNLCSSTVCTEVSDVDTYVFNVAHFTTYSVGGTVAPVGSDGGGLGGSGCISVSYDCSLWSSCVGGSQIKECISNCGIFTTETKTCEVELPPIGGGSDDGVPGENGPAGGGGGGGGGGGAQIVLDPLLVVEPSEIQLSLFPSERRNVAINITNLADNSRNVSLSQENFEGIVVSIDDTFEIGAGETNVIELTFTAPSNEGIYTGTVYVGKNPIYVSINVHSEDLPLNAEILVIGESKQINLNEKLQSRVNIGLLEEGLGEVEVSLNYFIMDFKGNVYSKETESLSFSDSVSFDKEFDTNNLFSGNYLLGLEVTYGGKVATSSSNFSILYIELGSSLMIYVIVAVIISVLLALIIWRISLSKRGSREVSLRE